MRHYKALISERQHTFRLGVPKTMAKKGELSKTARASLAQRDDKDFMTGRVCEKCGEPITLKDLQAVKVFGQGMQYYHKDHYKLA
jgi:hypothetical protein